MPRTKEDFSQLADRYDRSLRLNHYPVAVKMLKDMKEVEELRDEKGRPIRVLRDHRLTPCQFIAQSRYWGSFQAAPGENLNMCASPFGWREIPEEYPDGYVGAYFTESSIARKAYGSLRRFEMHQYAGMLCSSLERMVVDPDVVIFTGNTAQVMKLVYAYNCNKGEHIQSDTLGLGACSEMVITPMQTGKPTIFLPGIAARMLSWPSEHEAGFAMPGKFLEEVADGLEFNQRGMVRYPITWMFIDWEPPEGTVLRNVMDGKGYFAERAKKQ